jgi:translation initiation factor 1
MSDEKSRLVYSTDKPGPRRDKPEEKYPQRTNIRSPKGIYVRLDRKGRGGKSVTLIEGLPLPEKNGESFLKKLKTRLGTGGAMKNDVLEIQGDHCNAVLALLQDMGYKPKRAGG